MGMTMRERRTWLSQIRRIHYEQRLAYEQEFIRQTEYITEMRNRETE
jgi:hypothetical protein